jgi:hypothetical protein
VSHAACAFSLAFSSSRWRFLACLSAQKTHAPTQQLSRANVYSSSVVTFCAVDALSGAVMDAAPEIAPFVGGAPLDARGVGQLEAAEAISLSISALIAGEESTVAAFWSRLSRPLRSGSLARGSDEVPAM